MAATDSTLTSVPSLREPRWGRLSYGTVALCSAHSRSAGRTFRLSATYTLWASTLSVDDGSVAPRWAAHASRRGAAVASKRDPRIGARPTWVSLATASPWSAQEAYANALRAPRTSSSQVQFTPVPIEGGYIPVRRLLKSFAASKATNRPRAHVSNIIARFSSTFSFFSLAPKICSTA